MVAQASHLNRSRRAGWNGIVVTLALVAAIEVIEQSLFSIPVPISILQLGAVYTACVGRTAQGLFLSVIIAVYGGYKFAVPGRPLTYDVEGWWHVAVACISPASLVLIIGLFRSRAEASAAALRDRLVQEAQSSEREVGRTKLERQRIEYQTIFHSVPAMIWFKDKQNRILRANRLAAESIGRYVADVEGRCTDEFYPKEDAEKYLRDDLDVIQSGQPKLGILEPYARADGQRCWVRTDKLPYCNEQGEIMGVIVFAVDVTEQIQAREAIQNARNELEERVRQRTEELTQANETLRHEITERERAESSRQATEHRLQQIIDNTTAVVYAKDEGGRYLFINRRFEELFHIRRDAMAGRTDHELFPKEHADAFRANDLRVFLSARPVEFEETAPHDDGPHHYISLKFPLLDDAGRPTAVCGISTDISERKKTEQLLRSSEQQLTDLFENAPVGIHVVDPKGYIIRANKAELDLLGYSHDELVGRHVSEYYVDPGVMEDILARLARGETIHHYEAQIRCKDGSIRHVLFDKNVHWQDGEFLHTRCFTTDITDRKKAEQELRRHAAQLEAANHELAAARIEAEAANRAKSRFLANISHEVRTPIMAMLAAAEMMEPTDPRLDDGTKHVEIILRNGGHLLALVDELLDVSRIEAGKLELHIEESPLPEILADVAAITAPQRRGKPVEFRVTFATDVPKTVRTDRLRMTQAVVNLVNNAIKFTSQGRVETRVRVERSEPEPRMIIEVEDTGVGIRPEDQERIFESFAQVNPISRGASAGTGLGLPIAKSIAERLGGTLQVESELGRGSCFRLTLPTGPLDNVEWLSPDDAKARVNSGPIRSGPSIPQVKLKGRVLLAEDADDTRELICEALVRTGVVVVTARNGIEAVVLASRSTFDLILLDIRMPELDGIAAAEQIRGGGYRLAMVALTASTSGRDRERLLAAGFDDIWGKPIALGRLVEKAAEYLAHADDPKAIGPSVKAASNVDGESAGPLGAVDTNARFGSGVSAERWKAAIADFQASMPERMRVIREAVESADFPRAEESLHQLIGTTGMYGWTEVAQQACRLRESLKARDAQQIRERLAALLQSAQSAEKMSD